MSGNVYFNPIPLIPNGSFPFPIPGLAMMFYSHSSPIPIGYSHSLPPSFPYCFISFP